MCNKLLFKESQNTLSWKGPPRVIKSNSWHRTAPKCHTLCLTALSKCFLNSARLVLWPLPWGAVPVPKHSLGEEPSPNVHSKPLLTQLQAIPWGAVTVSTEQRSVPVPPLPSQEAVTAVRAPLSLIQAEQTKGPQPILTQLLLQALKSRAWEARGLGWALQTNQKQCYYSIIPVFHTTLLSFVTLLMEFWKDGTITAAGYFCWKWLLLFFSLVDLASCV